MRVSPVPWLQAWVMLPGLFWGLIGNFDRSVVVDSNKRDQEILCVAVFGLQFALVRLWMAVCGLWDFYSRSCMPGTAKITRNIIDSIATTDVLFVQNLPIDSVRHVTPLHIPHL
jgi:hypothetical protein